MKHGLNIILPDSSLHRITNGGGLASDRRVFSPNQWQSYKFTHFWQEKASMGVPSYTITVMFHPIQSRRCWSLCTLAPTRICSQRRHKCSTTDLTSGDSESKITGDWKPQSVQEDGSPDWRSPDWGSPDWGPKLSLVSWCFVWNVCLWGRSHWHHTTAASSSASTHTCVHTRQRLPNKRRRR